MWWKVFNIALYQTIWFCCVLGGNPWSIAGLGLIALHLALSPRRYDDLKMIVILLGVGCLLDGSLQLLGIVEFTTPGLPIPLWLAVIWMGLALLVHHSLNWMKGRYLQSAVFGAIGGPLVFAVIAQVTGSSRLAILSLGMLFVAGFLVLWRLRLPEGE